MRKRLTLINSIAGLVNRIVTIVFVFLVRHFFTKYLNVEFLGFEGLFSNILGLFSLVDLGLGTAISFDLYKPIYENDREQVSSIMLLFKRIYILVGVIIFALSLCFAPFILNFIKDYTVPGNDIRIYFLIYALGVAVSYFFSYKRTLIFAYQRNHIVINIDSIAKSVLSVVQIFILIKLKNYNLYLVSTVVINLLANVVISICTSKGNYYDIKGVRPLSSEYKTKLREHVLALAVTNVAWRGIISTDNILISSMIGVLDLAKNANYSTISQSINSIVSSALGGVSASIGDLLAENNVQKIKDYFDRYCFIFYIVSSYVALGVFFVSESVITIWVGGDLVYDWVPVLLVSINLFLSLIFRPLAEYQNYSGSFVYYKPYSIVALLINLVVSIVLGKLIGITGIFIGTTLAYIFMIIAVVAIIYKHVFHSGVADYYIKTLKNILPLLTSGFVLIVIRKFFNTSIIVLNVIISFACVTVVYCGFVYVFLRKDNEFVFFKNFIQSLLKKKHDR